MNPEINIINIQSINEYIKIESNFYIGEIVYVLDSHNGKWCILNSRVLFIGIVSISQNDLIYICDRNIHRDHKIYYDDEIFKTHEEACAALIIKLELNIKYIMDMRKIMVQEGKNKKKREKQEDRIKIKLDRNGQDRLY